MHLNDISFLSNLLSLSFINLRINDISDIKTLVTNSGLNNGDIVNLTYNPLSDTSKNIYIPQLEARGVTVNQ